MSVRSKLKAEFLQLMSCIDKVKTQAILQQADFAGSLPTNWSLTLQALQTLDLGIYGKGGHLSGDTLVAYVLSLQVTAIRSMHPWCAAVSS